MPDIFIDKDPEPIKLPDKESPPVKKEEKVLQKSLPANKNKDELIEELNLQTHKGKHFHALGSYCENPPEVKFTNALDNEILLLFLRRHFITNFPWILKAIALALIPILFEVLGALGFFSVDFVDSAGKLVIYSFYYFFILSGYIFVNYMGWFYNISIVTNIRVIDIDFSQLIFENVAATKLTQLEDVNYAQIGVFRSMFDYGDVFLQTAGPSSNFEFLAVPHPERIIKVIDNLIGRKKQ